MRRLQGMYRALTLCVVIMLLVIGGARAISAESTLPDGEYSIELSMSGGSGKASVETPTLLTVEDGKLYARIVWSSSNYDYMLVEGQRYDNISEGGNSTFLIPVTTVDEEMVVLADTLAMGTPHEIEYRLQFYADSIGSKEDLPQESAKRVLYVAAVMIVGGGILNHFVQKRRRQDYTGKKRTRNH